MRRSIAMGKGWVFLIFVNVCMNSVEVSEFSEHCMFAVDLNATHTLFCKNILCLRLCDDVSEHVHS